MMKSMVNLLIALLIINPGNAFAAAKKVTLAQEAQAIESEMDQVQADPGNDATIDRQLKLVDRTAEFIKSALSAKPDQKLLETVTRILVRITPYDMQNGVVDVNLKALKANYDAINKILKRYEARKAFPKEQLEMVRENLGIAEDVSKHGNDRGPNNKSKAPKAK